jgi:aarF domain-containing kinase
MSNLFKDRFKRSLALGKMAVQVGVREFTSGDLQSRIDQAKILAEGLGQLRGAAMKAGQMLSLDLADYFPPEAVQILSQLQNQVAESPHLNIEEVLNKELGPERRSRIIGLDPKPIAAASIGQVYRARIDDRLVAIKAQYPDVDQSIKSDIDVLKKIFSTFCLLTGRQMDLGPAFAEIETVLRGELDYEREAKYVVQFGELFAKHAWRGCQFRAPQVYNDYSTGRILTLSFENGRTLKDWMSSKPSAEQRELVGESLVELLMMEVFSWRLIQTDPNPSNYLIDDSLERPQIVAIDFGATKSYTPEFIKAYRSLIRTMSEGNAKSIIESSVGLGLIDPRESDESKALFVELLVLGAEPFQQPLPGQTRKFKFKDAVFLQENIRISRLLLSKLKYSPPPNQLLFLNRKLGGIYAILRKLDVEIDLTPYMKVIIGED